MGLLDNISGGGRGGRGMSPITMALMGLLAYRTMKGKGRLSDMLGGGGIGGLGSVLGSGALSGGLADLIRGFQNHGQGDKAKSWISTTEPNKPIAPAELETTLGDERIQWLMQETGMSRQELLDGLSGELPEAVDELTPEGRLPNDEELKRLAAPSGSVN